MKGLPLQKTTGPPVKGVGVVFGASNLNIYLQKRKIFVAALPARMHGKENEQMNK